MVITWRQGAIFASGLVLGAAAAVWIVLALRPSAGPGPVTESAASRPQATVVAARPSTSCPSQPAAAPASAKDGQFEVTTDLSGNSARDIQAFILLGKEAVAAGRPRDAEVAFIMSCRVADRFRGSSSVEAADARYQLGRHYANLALETGGAAARNRGELLKRAELLYSDSLQAYREKLGDAHEKSRFASEGLGRVKQMLAQADQPPAAAPSMPAPAAATTAATATKPAPHKEQVAKAPTRSPQQQMGGPPRAKPSFDCAKARSTSEKLICSDPELARLDRDLGELHAWARNSAPDKAAFKRESDAAWRHREATCRDRQCLLAWYQQRRNQLLEEIDRRHEMPRSG